MLDLASRAAQTGRLREGFTAERFVRFLTAAMAGQRLLAHIVPTGVAVPIRSGYRELLETVLAAAATTNVAAAGSAATVVLTVDSPTPVRRAARNARTAQV